MDHLCNKDAIAFLIGVRKLFFLKTLDSGFVPSVPWVVGMGKKWGWGGSQTGTWGHTYLVPGLIELVFQL